MRHPLRSAVDLFRSKWWSIGWGVAAVAFALHVAALSLAPLSIGQAVLAGGLVFLAVLAERFFGFELGRRQWIGIGLVAVSLTLLTLTGGGGGGGAHADYSLAGMIIFEGIAVGVGVLLVSSHVSIWTDPSGFYVIWQVKREMVGERSKGRTSLRRVLLCQDANRIDRHVPREALEIVRNQNSFCSCQEWQRVAINPYARTRFIGN